MIIKKSQIYIKSLERFANLYIGLPSDYHLNLIKYPVIYFHDGQNLFYKEDSYAGETWGVEEVFDQVGFPQAIVVALSCAQTGNDRIKEYNVFESRFPSHPNWYVEGKGHVYLKYLFHELKPFIDLNYKTLSSPQHTFMIGSSMGGVISLEAAIFYSDYLGGVAGLSNAFYTSKDQIIDVLKTKTLKLNRLYLDTGDDETGLEMKDAYMQSNIEIAEIIKSYHTNVHFKFQMIKGGKHHEVDWKLRLPEIIFFLLNNYQ
jgi:predicted alpha/beta superfamily hydrolase